MVEPPKGLLIGYARVSTEDQDLALQRDALIKAGVAPLRIFEEKASGASDDRPSFVAVFRALRAGDTLVVWKLDRLGRRLSRLISTIERLKEKGVHLRVLTEAIDTTTPTGILMFHIIGAFAEFERNMGSSARRPAWPRRAPEAAWAGAGRSSRPRWWRRAGAWSRTKRRAARACP